MYARAAALRPEYEEPLLDRALALNRVMVSVHQACCLREMGERDELDRLRRGWRTSRAAGSTRRRTTPSRSRCAWADTCCSACSANPPRRTRPSWTRRLATAAHPYERPEHGLLRLADALQAADAGDWDEVAAQTADRDAAVRERHRGAGDRDDPAAGDTGRGRHPGSPGAVAADGLRRLERTPPLGLPAAAAGGRPRRAGGRAAAGRARRAPPPGARRRADRTGQPPGLHPLHRTAAGPGQHRVDGGPRGRRRRVQGRQRHVRAPRRRRRADPGGRRAVQRHPP